MALSPSMLDASMSTLYHTALNVHSSTSVWELIFGQREDVRADDKKGKKKAGGKEGRRDRERERGIDSESESKGGFPCQIS